jgi:hypothetical protein
VDVLTERQFRARWIIFAAGPDTCHDTMAPSITVQPRMSSMMCRRHSAVAVVLSMLALPRCVGVTRTQQYGIEVKRGATIEHKLEIARSVVTQERLNRLKSQITRQLPAVPDSALERMGLRWNETTFRSFTGGEPRTTVLILISMEEQPGVDAKAVVETAARMLEPEINGGGAAATPHSSPH